MLYWGNILSGHILFTVRNPYIDLFGHFDNDNTMRKQKENLINKFMNLTMASIKHLKNV